MRYRAIFTICAVFFLFGGQEVSAQSDTFNYVSDTIQTWTVPPCVTQITVQLWAGGGGSGDDFNCYFHDGYCAGGAGGYCEGVLSGLTTGEVLSLTVPSGGKWQGTCSNGYYGGNGGWPGGGSGGDNSTYFVEYGGGGGGYASLSINGTYYVITGAGGGGGSFSFYYANGGGGGSTTGGYGGNLHGTTKGGTGGNQTQGGNCQYNNCSCDTIPTSRGMYLQGGYGGGHGTCSCFSFGGGGGGGGYYGGGGGGDDYGGGGGGSSFPVSSFNSGGIVYLSQIDSMGSSGIGPQNYMPPGAPPIGIGEGGYNMDGGDGLIIITYKTNDVFSLHDSILAYPVCGSYNGSVMAVVSGLFSPYTYSWLPSGQTNQVATGLSTGTYTVNVADICGSTSSASIRLTAIPISLTANVTANNICHGDCTGSAAVIAVVGTPPFTYQWYPSGGNKSIASGLCAGNYTVQVTDKNGCTGTTGVTITQPVPIICSINAVTYPLCNGDTGNITASASGGLSPYSYKWSPSGQSTATATGIGADVYTLTVTDSNACTATISAIITQPARITLPIVVNNIPCNGGSGSVTVNASGGVTPYTYLWTPANLTTAVATGLSAGVYALQVNDYNGCAATNSVTISQPVTLAVNPTSTPSSCNLPDGTATINANGGTAPYTYLWGPGRQTNATATGLLSGTYTVSVTDNHNCTVSASVTITQSAMIVAAISAATNVSCYNGSNGSATVTGSGGVPPFTYLWTPGGITTATATNLFALSYTVTVTDNSGCSADASVTLTEPTPLNAFISEPKQICKDSTGILIAHASGGLVPYQYRWSSGALTDTAIITPITTNKYSVTVTDNNGCTASTTILLKYGPSFAVSVTGKNSVCAGDSTLICANAIGAIDGVNYQWSPTNNTNGCILVSPSVANIYTVTVVDGCGSTTTAAATIYSEPSPVINMGVNFSQGCEPFSVQFTNNTTLAKGKAAQYIWDFGNGDSSRSKNPVYCYKAAGKYNVSLTVVTDSGCSATLTRMDMITIYTPPKAAFTYSPQSISILSPTVIFKDNSIGPDKNNGGIIYWSWNFGDQTDSGSMEQNPVHTYQDTGTYCINLIVMSREGCTDTTTNCLAIEPDFKLYIPSAFTPDGNGINEIFKPVGQYVKNFEMYIFDRWGMEIFHTTDANNGWNGALHNSGQICEDGIYIYKISVTDSGENQHSYVGNVTLLK